MSQAAAPAHTLTHSHKHTHTFTQTHSHIHTNRHTQNQLTQPQANKYTPLSKRGFYNLALVTHERALRCHRR